MMLLLCLSAAAAASLQLLLLPGAPSCKEGRKAGASEQILGIRMRRGQLPLKRLKESTYLLMTPGLYILYLCISRFLWRLQAAHPHS